MQVELQCPECFHRFTSSLEATVGDVLDEINAEGPWYALGDGETFEDRIFTRLTEQSTFHCPCCHSVVPPSEQSLCEVSRELLAQW
ncbi:MAG: hypothetical protein K2R98_19620 [Gemmataceae bacterium]|nr:hypothetical protein [Gemmataceae bacterium]